jgi:TRAP-type transport system periplasmic protein
VKKTRRVCFGSVSAAWATALLGNPAQAAAEFDFRLGVNTPDGHPLTLRPSARRFWTRSEGEVLGK